MSEISSRRVCITGGLRGFGFQLASFFLQEGDKVSVTYAHDTPENQERFLHLQGLGSVRKYYMDFLESDSVRDALSEMIDTQDPIDLWINNAGISQAQRVLHTDEQDVHEILQINFFGLKQCSEYIGQHMKQQGHGQILQISSHQAVSGVIGVASYSMSKAAVIAYAQQRAKDWGDDNVQMNVVCPGFMKTDMTANLSDRAKNFARESNALKRLNAGENVAQLVYALSLQEDISGQVFACDSRGLRVI